MPFLRLQIADNWQLVYNQNLVATSTGPGRYIPLQPLILPITLDRHTLAIHTFNADAQPRWYLGCWATPVIAVPSELQRPIEGDRLIARINRTTLIRFPKLATDYQLKLEFPYWMDKINVFIWQYIGFEGEGLEVEDRIEGKIDSLLP